MMRTPSLARLVWWALALLCATASLLTFARPTAPWLDGALWAFLAILAARAAFQRPRTASTLPPLWEALWDAAVQRPWRAVSMGAAFVLTIWVLHRLPILPPGGTYRAYVVLWVLAIALYLLAVAPPRGWPRTDWSIWWEVNRRTALAGFTIVTLAFIVRLAPLTPPTSLSLLTFPAPPTGNPFTITPEGIPSMSLLITRSATRLADGALIGGRLVWVLIGTLTVANAFWIGTRLKGVQIGLLMAFFLALWPLHVQASHHAEPTTALLFGLTLTTLMLQRSLDRRSPLDWGWVGVACAATFYTAPGGWLAGVVVLAVLGYLLLAERRAMWVLHRDGLFIALGAFFLTIAPLLQFVWRTLQRAAVLALPQTLHLTSALNALASIGSRETLSPLVAALFLFGLFYATLRLFLREAEYRMAPMVLWFWCVLLLHANSPTPSTPTITLALGVPLLFFIALALWHLALLGQRAWRGLSIPTTLITGALLVALALVA